jgi:tetratricopeptide (TPR) repeat protein
VLLALVGTSIALAVYFSARGVWSYVSASGLQATISEQMHALNLPTRNIELPSELAVRARTAITAGNFTEARSIVANVLDTSKPEAWRFYPFDDFIDHIADLSDPGFVVRLDDWVTQNPSDAIPILLRAQYYMQLAWQERGGNFAADTPASHINEFRADMGKARADVDIALSLDDKDPYPPWLKMRILRGNGASAEFVEAFKAAIGRHPGYYRLYATFLEAVQPRWGGSVEAMYGFVGAVTRDAPKDSPLQLLWLTLYDDLLSTASTNCFANAGERLAQCVQAQMGNMLRPELQSNMPVALALYDHADRYQVTLAIGDALLRAVRIQGGDVYSGALLDIAARALRSDTRLREDAPGHNNYMIDEVVAESWYLKGYYDNALKKDQEAMAAVQAAPFPAEEERFQALAALYENMARAHDKLHQHVDTIVYEKAAIALGGVMPTGHYVCGSYYFLKAYDEAVAACTETLARDPQNIIANYWRGAALQDSKRDAAAQRDFEIVADSDNAWRSGAAISLSMTYFNRGDIKGALRSLNKYTYLYDPKTQRHEDMAVAYNNRCYAYMELGELNKALDDCTASLSYGSLPDAYRKQQELVKRLAAGKSL